LPLDVVLPLVRAVWPVLAREKCAQAEPLFTAPAPMPEEPEEEARAAAAGPEAGPGEAGGEGQPGPVAGQAEDPTGATAGAGPVAGESKPEGRRRKRGRRSGAPTKAGTEDGVLPGPADPEEARVRAEQKGEVVPQVNGGRVLDRMPSEAGQALGGMTCGRGGGDTAVASEGQEAVRDPDRPSPNGVKPEEGGGATSPGQDWPTAP
jgi:hypothetical protein